MQQLLDWLDGKKSYIVGYGTIALGVLVAIGATIPAWVWIIDAGGAILCLRDAITKLEPKSK